MKPLRTVLLTVLMLGAPAALMAAGPAQAAGDSVATKMKTWDPDSDGRSTWPRPTRPPAPGSTTSTAIAMARST